MYGRINGSGTLEIFSGRVLITEKRKILAPREKDMRAAGYKPIVSCEVRAKKKGSVLSVEYRDVGDRIEAVYTPEGEEND